METPITDTKILKLVLFVRRTIQSRFGFIPEKLTIITISICLTNIKINETTKHDSTHTINDEILHT